jgi:hypothetical protein
MISRLTVSALLFAVLGAATLTFAAEAQKHQLAARHEIAASAPTELVQWPRVEVIGHRAALSR